MIFLKKRFPALGASLLMLFSAAGTTFGITYDTNTDLTASPAWGENVQINSGVTVSLAENILPGQTTSITVNVDGTLSFNFTKTDNHAATNCLTNANNQSIAFTGTGTFVKTGAGSLAMLSNGYTDAALGYGVKFAMSDGALIDVQAGTLRNGGWANQNWSSNYADLQVASGAVYDLWDGTNSQFDSLVGAGTLTNGSNQNRLITIGAANSTWLVSGAQTTPEFSGTIKNGATKIVSLTKIGTGTQILSGTFSASGAITVSAGTLQIGNGTTGQITSTSPISIASGASFVYNTAKASEITGVVSGAGTLTVTKGELMLSNAANTFTGTWNVGAEGIFGLLKANFLDTAGTIDAGAYILMNVNEADATAFTGTQFSEFRTNNHFGTGVKVGIFTPAGVTAAQSIAGNFLSTNTDIYKSGSGTFAMTGTNDTFTSAIHVAKGAISLGDGTTAGAIDASDITVDAGASFIYNNGAGSTTTVMNKISGAGSLVFASGTCNYTTASPAITTKTDSTYGTGTTRFDVPQVTIKNGAKVVFADGVTPTFNKTGAITIEAGGTLELNSTKGEGHNYNNSIQSETNTLTINGAGTLVKTGTGAVAFLNRSPATGSIVIAQSEGGWIDIQEGVLVNGGWTSSISWSGNKGSLNLASGTRFNMWDNGYSIYVDNLTGSGTFERGSIILGVANNTNSTTYGVANNTAEFSGVIKQNGTYTTNVTKRGTGTQIFSGNNTYAGTTKIEAGTLQIGKGGENGKIGTGAVTMNNGTLVFKTQQTNTVASLSGTGTVSVEDSAKVTSNSALKFAGTLNVKSAADVIEFAPAANAASSLEGAITGSGTVAMNMADTNTLNLRLASVADTATVSVNGGTVLSGGNSFAGTLKVTENATVTLGSSVAYTAHPWSMTLYTDAGNAKASNGRIVAGGTNYSTSKTYDDVYDMWQCANNTDKTAVAALMTANYSSMAYRTMVEVLEDVSLDFSGSFDDTQGVWVIKCDANGNVLDGASWRTLLNFGTNCAANTAAAVALEKGYYLMDVRVCDQGGDRFANGNVKDADGKSLGIGMRVNGAANYSAMNIDTTTGVINGSNGTIVAGDAYISGAQVWNNAKFDIADGKTLTFDNPSAAATSYTIDADVTGTGTLKFTNSADSDTKFIANLNSAGSIATDDGIEIAISGAVAGDLTLGANSVLDFVISTDDLTPVVTVGGTATLGEGSAMNVFVTGDAPDNDELLTLTLVQTTDASKLVGFDNVDLNLTFEDPNFRLSAELLNGSYVLTLGNADTLPEPATWALLVLGVGFVFLGKRRAKRTA